MDVLASVRVTPARPASLCILALVSALLVGVIGCGDSAAPPTEEQVRDRAAVLGVAETGRIVIPALDDEVQVVRTEGNVPHIFASNEHDLRMVQGYIAAQDRWFSIEAGRRLGWGELTELLGDAALAADVGSRGQGTRAVAQRVLDQLTPEQMQMLDWYADGINAYIDAVDAGEAAPPTELALLNIVLRPGPPEGIMQHVTGRDLIGYLAVVTYQQGFESTDLTRARAEEQFAGAFDGVVAQALREAGLQEDLWDRVEPMTDVATTPGFGLTEGAPMATLTPTTGALRSLPRSRGASVAPGMLDRIVARADVWERYVHGGRDNEFGSNVWAVTGGSTPDGHAILSGDGHLPLTVPSLLYRSGLDTSVFGVADENARDELGLFFAGIPILAVGTNGRVAWSITYLYGDLTDWYAEEMTLDASGAPSATMFRGNAEPLTVIEESYEIAEIAGFLESAGRTEIWPRYTTFDGRIIAEIEGREATADTVPAAGETLVNVQGDFVVPADMNGDGIISAVSFDYTGLDVANTVTALDDFGRADSVRDMREASRRLVGFGQNVGAADVHGDVWYGSYNAMPCRENLRAADRSWADGANPRSLIDGTRYGAFEIPLNAEGLPDEDDPDHCLVPFDQWPMAISPADGFIANANNDVAGVTLDDDLTNDPYYIGAGWALGYRARTIRDRLADLSGSQTATVAEMQRLQADHTSPLALELADEFVAAITRAQAIDASDGIPTADEQRLLDLYLGEQAAMDDVKARIEAWVGRGAVAESGVETFYHSPTAEQRTDAVATMIWNAWLREATAGTFGDEGIEFVFGPDRSLRMSGLIRLMRGRGASNPENLASFDTATGESAFFDVVGTTPVEHSDEVLLAGLTTALGRLRAAPTGNGVGGFDSTDMNDWLWGLRHQVKFESLLVQFAGDVDGIGLIGNNIDTGVLPLMPGLDASDPRSPLTWFPRPGDVYSVDAAHPPFVPGADFFHANGPVMRMVIHMEEGNITGENILPGGQSALKSSEFFSDQAEQWLANETTPFRYEVADVVAGATGREVFTPVAATE